MTTTDHPATPGSTHGPEKSVRAPWRPGIWASALVGVISVGLAIGIAELLAALGGWIHLMHSAASPLNALGSAFINLTPEWLKEIAIRTFGQHDKDALKAGMGVTLLIVAAMVGLIARRSPRIAVGITAVLVAVVVTAVLTRPTTSLVDVLPMLLGGAVGVFFLVSAFRRTLVPDDAVSPSAVRVETPANAGAPTRPQLEVTSGTSTSGEHHPMATATAPSGWNRRQFFRFAAVGVAVAAAGGALARWIPSGADVEASRMRTKVPVTSDQQVIPAGVNQNVPNQPPFITPNETFYRVDTAFSLPALPAEEWSLKIHGLVDKEVSINYPDLVKRPQIERTITLTCVSNEVGGDLAGTATWIGARLDDLLKEAGPQAGADCVLCTSVDGFTISAPLDALTDGRDAMLAVAMNGEILPQKHGFPVRMVVPGLYGYVSATKWVVDMEVTQFSNVTAYWTARGWDDRAPIKTSSRIDVPKGFAQFATGQPAVIAGVAWAQHRGISAVEVQVDDGPWQKAELSESFSKDTWRQWKFAWTPPAGLHSVRCRATDGTGAIQDATVRPTLPNGSTGYDSRSITVS